MLSSVVGTMVSNNLREVQGLFGDLLDDRKTAIRYAKVLADKSGIQPHSVGETMVTSEIRELSKQWRKSALVFCCDELRKGMTLSRSVGRFDLISECEAMLDEVEYFMDLAIRTMPTMPTE